MIAQELALETPERVEKLVLVCTTPGGSNAAPMPAQTVQLMAEAPTLEPLVALRKFVENALAPDPPEGMVERILAHRIETAQPPSAWLSQAVGRSRVRRLGPAPAARRADARRPRHSGCRRRPGQRAAARGADPGRARSSCSPAAGISSSGSSRNVSSASWESSSDERRTHHLALARGSAAQHAEPRRDRLRRRTADLRGRSPSGRTGSRERSSTAAWCTATGSPR